MLYPTELRARAGESTHPAIERNAFPAPFDDAIIRSLIDSLDALSFQTTLARTPAAALVLFARESDPNLKSMKLLLEEAAASRDWSLFWVDPAFDPAWVQSLGLTALPSLWLYVDGDYHANVLAMPGVSAFSRPAAIAAAVAKARLGPPMPPPGA